MRYVEKRRIDSQQIFEIYYTKNFGLVPIADIKETLDALCRFENMTYRRIERLAMYLASTQSCVKGQPIKQIMDELNQLSIISLTVHKKKYVDTDSTFTGAGGCYIIPTERTLQWLEKKQKLNALYGKASIDNKL